MSGRMEAVMTRARQAAARRVDAVLTAMVETAADDLPGDVAVSRGGDDAVVLAGRGLWRRMAFDARLRGFGRTGR